MSSFKTEINALYAKQKKELQNAITNYLNKEFKEFFEKNPSVNFVKINAEQSYNDSDYSSYVYKDTENIKINAYSWIDIDNEDWDDDDCVKNIGLTREQHENLAEEAYIIFDQIDDSILLNIYGNSFGLKIDRRGCITLESSDIETY
jgi:hypothetical protein